MDPEGLPPNKFWHYWIPSLLPDHPHGTDRQLTACALSAAHIPGQVVYGVWCLRRILNITWSKHVTNSEVRRRTGHPLLSDKVRARRLKLFGHMARADKPQDHSRALRACIWHSPKN